MNKRIILQAVFAKDGLVIDVRDDLSLEQLKLVILDAVPAEFLVPDLEIFDEADDHTESRPFADCEDLRHGRVIHVGRCPHVQVLVRYAGRVAEHRFPPATRFGRIKRWAVHHLGISSGDANELVLQIAGGSVQPTRDQHVGSFVERDSCEVVLDLVRSYTVNGDASVPPDHACLIDHLNQAPFVMGEANGRWRLCEITWPFVFIDVAARDKRQFTLRLQCDGYPSAPTGAFWDLANGCWLPAHRWPSTGARFGAALRSDWQGGTALYIPCDRNSIVGHEQWLSLHPAWAWDPSVGIARYLDIVWTMTNGDDYVAPAA